MAPAGRKFQQYHFPTHLTKRGVTSRVLTGLQKPLLPCSGPTCFVGCRSAIAVALGQLCQVVGDGKPRLAALLAEPTHPVTGQPLKTMAIPVDASVLGRVRSELGDGVEYRIGVFTKIISVSTAESTHVLRQNTPIAGYLTIWFHILGLSDQKNPTEQRFKFLMGDLAISKDAQIFTEAGLEFGEAFMCDLKIDLFSDIPLQMSEFEPDDRFWKDQSILADLSKKTDVEGERPQPVIAVRYTDERPECVRPVLGGDELEVQGR